MAEVLYRERMSILAYSPLAGGMLTGKYAGGARPAGTRYARFDTIGQRYRKPMVAEAIDAYAALARSRGLTLVELALGYVTSRWFVGATIIGATSLAQLDENLAACAKTLDADTLREITAIQARYPDPAT
jgi:aryl-alcohol dehydrogenase-like predicted oxidoreductase